MNTNAPPDLDPKSWGSHMWATIHVLALQADKSNFINFIHSIENLLPCKKCRDHFKEYLKKNPIKSSTLSPFAWTVEFHNAVNLRIGKSIVDLETARSLWLTDSCSYSCSEPKKPTAQFKPLFLILILLLLVVAYTLMAQKK
jgi:FAD-linked sulfhydryl oxidase